MIGGIAHELKKGEQIAILSMNIATNIDWWFELKEHGLGAHTEPGNEAKCFDLLLTEWEGSVGVVEFEFVEAGDN